MSNLADDYEERNPKLQCHNRKRAVPDQQSGERNGSRLARLEVDTRWLADLLPWLSDEVPAPRRRFRHRAGWSDVGSAAVASHPDATMHNLAAVGQRQTLGSIPSVNRVTVSDLITFWRHTEPTKSEGFMLGALAQVSEG